MADFAARADQQGGNEDALVAIGSIAEFDLYCHYVAGLVGEGLALLFAASGEEPTLLAPASLLGAQSESPYRLAPGIAELSNSLGLFLQKTNITRDVREDVDEHRFFWPREIWGATRYGGGFGGVEEMCLAGVSNAASEWRAIYQ
jgi:farnesyl-diphosphate farnesyltransferase